VCVARCIELHDRFYEQRVCVLCVCVWHVVLDCVTGSMNRACVLETDRSSASASTPKED